MLNSFGQILRMTTFGESHGAGLGCVVDGCPAGVTTEEKLLLRQLDRRRPGQSQITTSRNESDAPEILSGIFENKTLGTPIAMIVRNKDQRSGDYESIKKVPRVGHADKTWKEKFTHVDHRGGGRSSGRETVSRVMAGWVAEAVLNQLHPSLSVVAHVKSIGEITMPDVSTENPFTREDVDAFACRCPHETTAQQMEEMLLKAKEQGNSFGGEVSLTISNPPSGLGEPVFLKTQNYLASALTSIGTVNGITWNEKPISSPGVEFHKDNAYGGFNGGITNGADIRLTLLCKPVSTIGDAARKGRHDPCVLPRIVPVVEAMAAFVLADLALINQMRNV